MDETTRLARDIELARTTLHVAEHQLAVARAAAILPAHLADWEPEGHGMDIGSGPFASADLRALHVAAHEGDVAEAENTLAAFVAQGQVVMAGEDGLVPFCPCGLRVRFMAHYGAPGTGQAWQCEAGHDWARVGGSFCPPESGAHLLTLEDVR